MTDRKGTGAGLRLPSPTEALQQAVAQALETAPDDAAREELAQAAALAARLLDEVGG